MERMVLLLIMLMVSAASAQGTRPNNMTTNPGIAGTDIVWCPRGTTTDYKCTFSAMAAYYWASPVFSGSAVAQGSTGGGQLGNPAFGINAKTVPSTIYNAHGTCPGANCTAFDFVLNSSITGDATGNYWTGFTLIGGGGDGAISTGACCGATYPYIEFYKSGGTYASPTSVAASWFLGELAFLSNTGAGTATQEVLIDVVTNSGGASLGQINYAINGGGGVSQTNPTFIMNATRFSGNSGVTTLLFPGLATTGTAVGALCIDTTGKFFADSSLTICGLTSSIKGKQNIKVFDASDELIKLKPVTFERKPYEERRGHYPGRRVSHFTDDPNHSKPQIGLTAENVCEVDSKLCVYERDGVTPRSYRPEAVIGLLVAGYKRQQAEIDDLKRMLGR